MELLKISNKNRAEIISKAFALFIIQYSIPLCHQPTVISAFLSEVGRSLFNARPYASLFELLEYLITFARHMLF